MHELELDRLKENCRLIHFFGLGFVQLKISDTERYHFYHPELEAFTEEPHDHRYHFISKVLKGSLVNKVWRVDDQGEKAELRYESCNKDVSDVPASYPCNRSQVGSFEVKAGSSYYIDENTFHQVERSSTGPCITKLTRGPVIKDFARILTTPGAEEACPFSRNLPEEDLWKIIVDCLKCG